MRTERRIKKTRVAFDTVESRPAVRLEVGASQGGNRFAPSTPCWLGVPISILPNLLIYRLVTVFAHTETRPLRGDIGMERKNRLHPAVTELMSNVCPRVVLPVMTSEQRSDERARRLTPYQLFNQLWKKYEDLEPEDRRVRIMEELKRLDLPPQVMNRLLREFL